jgi:hypothetical protein
MSNDPEPSMVRTGLAVNFHDNPLDSWEINRIIYLIAYLKHNVVILKLVISPPINSFADRRGCLERFYKDTHLFGNMQRHRVYFFHFTPNLPLLG